MPKDPAVLLYTSDFLSGTFTMSNEQVGKYIRLLCLQHQKGHLTEKDMLNICQSYDEEIYSKFDSQDGLYWNQRMFDEAEKRKNYTKSRSNNRKKNICQSYDNHMENENENEIIIEDDNIKRIWNKWKEYKLNEFKDKYKTIKSEQISFNKFISMSNGNINELEEIIDTSIANRWKGLFPVTKNNNQIKSKTNDKLNAYEQFIERNT